MLLKKGGSLEVSEWIEGVAGVFVLFGLSTNVGTGVAKCQSKGQD